MPTIRTNFWVIFLLFAALIHAQTGGKVTGKITDKDTGEPIPFANVFVEGTSTGSASDIDGNYVILNLAPGLYSISASVVGYQKVTTKDVRVNVDFTTKLDFVLSTGAVDLPAVIVQGERNPLIRKDLTNPTASINAESLQELPVDQISDVIRLQAGVVTGNDGSLHVRGGRSNEIAFTLNGISLNDPYGNSNPVGIATNAVQEVSVSTGTFSAQYGNALSGVVNYVTKEGGEKYSLSLRSYMGDYFTGRESLYPNIDDVDPLNRVRGEFTLGGPIPELKDAKFYLSSVIETFNGRLYGQRLYKPTDAFLTPDNFRSTDPRSGGSNDPYYFNPFLNNSNGLPTGDGAFVPMNTFTSYNIQGNLSYKFTPTIKLKYELVFDQGESKGYSNSYKYNPDGVGTNYSSALVQSLDFTHTLNDKMFYTLKLSLGENESKYYLYEDFNNPGYLPALYQRTIGNTFFLAGGTDNSRSFRTTKTIGIKGDLVLQAFENHEIKAGFETRLHDLSVESYSVEIGKLTSTGGFGNLVFDDLLYDSTLTLVRRKPTSPSLYTNYSKKPVSFSAYLQDKMEFGSAFILNAGVRYEFFDPAASYNPEISRNLTDSLFGFITAYNEPAEIKHTLSPRISMSYPITDQAVIRLSYGHFYQIGSLASLYSNTQYFVTNVGSVPTFGNPNVQPQKSVQYEIGLQQQLTEDFKFDVTAYYKDVTNYIFTQGVFTSTGREYNVLTNLAYANSRGVTFSFLKRRSPGSMFSASLDYTISVSEGNRTEPADEIFFSELSGKQTETFLVPLSFDRTHVINGSISISDPDNWTIGAIATLETGTPYSVSLPSNLVQVRYNQNSDNQPINLNVNMKVEKYFRLFNVPITVFLQVENLFDTENELVVYSSSGRALSNVEQIQSAVQFNDIRRRISRGDAGLFGMSQIDNYYSQRPERVSAPREVRFGFSLLFN
ncbi:MAG: TonB-dependent receptor [Ignavibacteriaceae bacterium]|nr:TonB-dependent receptor [Ignavibacteriaceae bacterium]